MRKDITLKVKGKQFRKTMPLAIVFAKNHETKIHYEDETEELSESSKQEKANKEILIISSSRRGTYLIALVVESLKLQHTENEQFYQTNMVMTFRTKDQLN